MSRKKLQGADGVNFELQISIAGLESINLQEECLRNEAGNEIVTVKCWGGKLSVYVSLPNAVRANNIQPFQLTDCIKIELVKGHVIDFLRAYLQRSLKGKYSEELLQQLRVTKMECNLTAKCAGECKPKDVISLFEKAFPKVTVYKETDDKGKPHKKPERGITVSKAHEWILKVYDKSYQQRKAGDLKVEENLVRVEIVFLERMLGRMYSDKRSIEEILTGKALRALISQYQVTLDEIFEKQLKPLLKKCTQEVFESLTCSSSGKEVSDTLISCKEVIVDIEVLRKALKKWYRLRDLPDNSKRIIFYYRHHGKFGIPVDVIKTLKLIHSSAG